MYVPADTEETMTLEALIKRVLSTSDHKPVQQLYTTINIVACAWYSDQPEHQVRLWASHLAGCVVEVDEIDEVVVRRVLQNCCGLVTCLLKLKLDERTRGQLEFIQWAARLSNPKPT